MKASIHSWTRRNWLMTVAFVALLPLSAWASGPVNVNSQGVAIKGYDPVAYFVVGRPVMGLPEFSAKSNGALYWFSNATNQQAFAANPERYEPQFGGFCAFGVAKGAKPDIDPNAFAIVDGKLYLNLSLDVQKRWQADVPSHISQASKNWLNLKNQ